MLRCRSAVKFVTTVSAGKRAPISVERVRRGKDTRTLSFAFEEHQIFVDYAIFDIHDHSSSTS